MYKCTGCDYHSLLLQNAHRHVARQNRCSPHPTIVETKAFICDTCTKKFAFQSGLSRHRRSCGTVKADDLETLKREIEQLKQQAAPSINVNINSSITNTNSHNSTVKNSVKIHAYGEDPPPKLSYEELYRLLGRGPRQTLFKLINDQHFNTEKPEAMNFYISNFKDRIARFFDGVDWGMKDAEELVDEVFDRYRGLVDDMLDELAFDSEDEETLARRKETILAKLRTHIDKWQKRTEKELFEEGIKGELKNMIYGKKEMVKRVHSINR